MIKMISSPNLKKTDSTAISPPDSKEPENDEFAALLNGLSLIAPVIISPQKSASPQNDETISVNQNADISDEPVKQPLPEFAESIVLPKNFGEVFKLEKSSVKEFSAAQLAENNLSAQAETINISEADNLQDFKEKSFSEDFFAQIAEISVESNSTEDGKPEFKFSEINSQIETFPANEKSELANKLPKLFREVSNFFEAANSLTKDSPNLSETAPPPPVAHSDITEQIELQTLQMAVLAAKTGKPQILKMRLNPAELGAVEIKIEKDSAGSLNAHFQTENEEARKILTENLAQLRDSLQDSGWQVERVEVSCGAFSSAGNEAGENSSTAFENTARNSFFQTAKADGFADHKDELNSEKSNRLLSVRA